MISNKCYYALKAMLELALREGEGPAPISGIAEAQGIPSRFLEAILRQLKQSGFTESVRGKDGGYILSRPAGTITVGEIIRLFEGPLISVNPGAENGREGHPFSALWSEAESALARVYDGADFARLAEETRRARQDGVHNYSI